MPAKTLDGAYRNLLMSQKIAYSLIAVILLCSCQGKLQSNPQKIGGKSMELKITSSAFEEGGMIPKQYTCDGANISPPLRWTSVPLGTKSLALICDDPDAPMEYGCIGLSLIYPPILMSYLRVYHPKKHLKTVQSKG